MCVCVREMERECAWQMVQAGVKFQQRRGKQSANTTTNPTYSSLVRPHSAANNIESHDAIKETDLLEKVYFLTEHTLLPATLVFNCFQVESDHECIGP